MKRFWYAVNKKTADGKLYAVVMSATEQCNIANQIQDGKTLACNPCESKKRANELTDLWNESYRKNGTYAY